VAQRDGPAVPHAPALGRCDPVGRPLVGTFALYGNRAAAAGVGRHAFPPGRCENRLAVVVGRALRRGQPGMVRHRLDLAGDHRRRRGRLQFAADRFARRRVVLADGRAAAGLRLLPLPGQAAHPRCDRPEHADGSRLGSSVRGSQPAIPPERGDAGMGERRGHHGRGRALVVCAGGLSARGPEYHVRTARLLRGGRRYLLRLHSNGRGDVSLLRVSQQGRGALQVAPDGGACADCRRPGDR